MPQENWDWLASNSPASNADYSTGRPSPKKRSMSFRITDNEGISLGSLEVPDIDRKTPGKDESITKNESQAEEAEEECAEVLEYTSGGDGSDSEDDDGTYEEEEEEAVEVEVEVEIDDDEEEYEEEYEETYHSGDENSETNDAAKEDRLTSGANNGVKSSSGDAASGSNIPPESKKPTQRGTNVRKSSNAKGKNTPQSASVLEKQNKRLPVRPQRTGRKDDDDDDDEANIKWEKPAWTKNVKLRSTGKGEILKTQGNLATPITAIAQVAGQKKDLAFEKPDWTKKTNLNKTKKGEKLKSGETIARPIGGIKPVDN